MKNFKLVTFALLGFAATSLASCNAPKEETTEETETIKECLVYGSKVDNFHTLDKSYIYTLNVCATQELYKSIQQQNIIVQDLQNRINILENNNI
jgi:hypothetical protein